MSVQHTAWMLVNLLARLVDVVSEVRVVGADSPLHERVIPFSTGETRLQASLVRSGALIGGVPVIAGESRANGTALTIGPGAAADGSRVYGEGFCGAFSHRSISSVADSPLPFGPYVAACLAAAEVFRQVRLRPDLYVPTRGLSLSAWDYTTSDGSLSSIGPRLGPTDLVFGLAGVGAVGSACLHALWASPSLKGRAVIADSDPDGIDTTNLNRCVTFHAQHIGCPKATTAADLLRESGIVWSPLDERYRLQALPFNPSVLISAVDTNRSREQLQQGFWPARLLAGSTNELRAEIVRCGPPGTGPCLRCYNPPAIDLPDDLARERLRSMTGAELAAFAAEISRPVDLVHRWAREGGCGEVGDAALKHLRDNDEPAPMFSVGFVSALAGTLLAAEIVKEHVGRSTPLDDRRQTSKFQFWRPTAANNGRPQPIQRDPSCPACAPGEIGVEAWRSRASSWTVIDPA